MHMMCTICCDIVRQTDGVNMIKCGHMYHSHCLSQWLRRSKTCPQCRLSVKSRYSRKVYPTVCEESRDERTAALQRRLNASLAALRQQRAGQAEAEEIASAEAEVSQNIDLLLEACESRAERGDPAIIAMREQIKYIKYKNNETEKLKKEIEILQKENDGLYGLLREFASKKQDTLERQQAIEETTSSSTVAKKSSQDALLSSARDAGATTLSTRPTSTITRPINIHSRLTTKRVLKRLNPASLCVIH